MGRQSEILTRFARKATFSGVLPHENQTLPRLQPAQAAIGIRRSQGSPLRRDAILPRVQSRKVAPLGGHCEGGRMTPERFPYNGQMMRTSQIRRYHLEMSIDQIRYRLRAGCDTTELVNGYQRQPMTKPQLAPLGHAPKTIADAGSLDVESATGIARAVRRHIVRAVNNGHAGLLVSRDGSGNYRTAPSDSVQASTMQGPRWNIVGTYNAAADVSQIADDIREAAEDFA